MKPFHKLKERFRHHIKLPDAGAILFLFGVTLLNRIWLLPDITTHVFRGIPNIYTWMALWNCRVLETLNFSMYWTSNAMYPYPNAFAFSENMMGFTPLVCPIWKITGNPVFAINLLSLLLLWLTAVITYYILKSFDFSRFASLIGALLFSFYPWVLKMSSLGRFHMQGLMWLPIILMANYKFWQTGKKKYLFISSLFWLWTFLISLYLGIFLAVFLGIWNFIWFFYERKLFPWKKIVSWCISAFMVWVIMVPIFLVYYQVSSKMGVERSLENQVQYTGPVWSWFTVPDENWLWGQTVKILPTGTKDGIVENFIFPGFICLALFIGVFFIRKMPKWLKSMKWTAVSLIILAIGPFMLGLPWKIPMPFTLLWSLFPPMKATRNPHRLAIFALLCMVFLAAYLINRWEIKKKIPMILKILLIGFILMETFNYVKPKQAITPSTHLIYEKIKNPEKLHTVIELPMNTANNLRAVNFSCFHWNRVINGTSNYWPPMLSQLEHELKQFPTPHTIQLLQALRVDRIIFHEYQFSKEQRYNLEKRLRRTPEVGFIERIAGYSMWSLEEGKKFLPLSPHKDFRISGPSKLVGGLPEAAFSLEAPPARSDILFNLRAPFWSQFLASKRWYIKPLSYPAVETPKTDEKINWKAPAFFHPLNWRKKVSIKITPQATKTDISLDIMGDSIQLAHGIPVIPLKNTNSSIPTYFLLPEGYKEIPLHQVKVQFTPHCQLMPKGKKGQLLKGSIEVMNPGPYYWTSQKNNGVYLGVIIDISNQSGLFSFPLPHDLFPGDKATIYISLTLPGNIEENQIYINCFGRSKPHEFNWFYEANRAIPTVSE